MIPQRGDSSMNDPADAVTSLLSCEVPRSWIFKAIVCGKAGRKEKSLNRGSGLLGPNPGSVV